MEFLARVIPWLQIILAVAITAAILLQRNESGLGSAFGGSEQVAHTKRGIEKGLFVTTVVLAGLFIISAIIALFLNRAI